MPKHEHSVYCNCPIELTAEAMDRVVNELKERTIRPGCIMRVAPRIEIYPLYQYDPDDEVCELHG